jgi:group I intron endonuclease
MGTIYCVRNLIDGKRYIGKTERTVDERWLEHLYDAERGSDTYFHRAIRKHGALAFFVEAIGVADDARQLNAMEKHFISYLASYVPTLGYNCTLGGTGGRPNELTLAKLRKPKTEDHRRKLSEIAKNRPRGNLHTITPEANAKRSRSLKGRVFSEATLRKMSEAKKGKPSHISAESRRRRARQMAGSGNPMFGLKMTAEHQQKLQSAVSKWRQGMSTEMRQEIARRASRARWNKITDPKERAEQMTAARAARWAERRTAHGMA